MHEFKAKQQQEALEKKAAEERAAREQAARDEAKLNKLSRAAEGIKKKLTKSLRR